MVLHIWETINVSLMHASNRCLAMMPTPRVVNSATLFSISFPTSQNNIVSFSRTGFLTLFPFHEKKQKQHNSGKFYGISIVKFSLASKPSSVTKGLSYILHIVFACIQENVTAKQCSPYRGLMLSTYTYMPFILLTRNTKKIKF